MKKQQEFNDNSSLGMRLFKQIDAHTQIYAFCTLLIYLLINNGINAQSVWMESTRHGTSSIQWWEPIVWEYTSALSVLICLPLLLFCFRRSPPSFANIKRQLGFHFAMSVIFSLLHVSIMVGCREVIYVIAGGEYQFGDWLRELFYEYRKDAWGYLLFYVAYHVIYHLYLRIKGDATFVNQEETNHTASSENTVPDTSSIALPEHFLVKKLDKEFIVKVTTIEWLESAGNYVNLHSQGRIYPMRTTLSALTDRLSQAGFSRIHRSYSVNHNAISSVQYIHSGDGEITLINGKKLPLSRRFKEGFKANLS